MAANDTVIRQKLEDIGESYDGLKLFIQDYLQKIETVAQSYHDNLTIAQKILRGPDFTVAYVAKALGISRTTFYSYNHLLQRYVEHTQELFEQDNPCKLMKSLVDANMLLKEKVALMETRDVRELLLLNENNCLRETIKEKNAEIDRLRTQLFKKSTSKSQ